MKTSMMKRAAAVFAASALMCGVVAAPALAATPIEKSGTSEVTVTQAAPGQISVTIPAQIPVVADQTGKFLAPDAKYTTITNASNFAVKVAKVQAKVIDETKMKLVAKDASLAATEGGPLNMWMTVTSGSDTLDLNNFTTAETPATPDQWIMAAGDGALNLKVEGAMTDTATGVTGVHALDVVWTVAI